MGPITNDLKAEDRGYTFQESAGFCLNWIALQCLKPMHRSTEMFIHSYFTQIRPGEFGNLSTETLEKVSRVFQLAFCVATSPVAILGFGLSFALDSLGDYMTQKSYTRLKGNAEEVKNPTPKLLTLNACMMWGGLPILFGGVRPARERMDEMADLILSKSPDVVLMQEVSFESGLCLWGKLKNTYAHGFTRIDPMPGAALDSLLFIASKLEIVKEPIFYPLPSNKSIKRGVFYFETPQHVIFTAHLEAGDEVADAAMRKVQLEKIIAKMKEVQEESCKECLLLGDLNINLKHEADDEYTASGLDTHLANDAFPAHIVEETATCTSRLTAYAKGEEVQGEDFEHIDYALRLKRTFGVSLSTEQVPTYDLKRPDKALSDHKGLLVQTRTSYYHQE